MAYKTRVLCKRDEWIEIMHDLLGSSDNPRKGRPGEAKTRGTHARTNLRLAREKFAERFPRQTI